MKWKNWTRLSHRWVSITFNVIVAIFIVQGVGVKIASLVYFLPLIPLALLVLTGLYMFFEPPVFRVLRRKVVERPMRRHVSGEAGWL